MCLVISFISLVHNKKANVTSGNRQEVRIYIRIYMYRVLTPKKNQETNKELYKQLIFDNNIYIV